MSNLEEYLDPVAYDLENPSFTPDGPFYATLAGRVGGPVLELGAGTGRIAIPLAKAGFQVTGLDLCVPMLEHARAKSGDLPVRWTRGDSTGFDLGERFGLIFIAGHGFQAFLSQEALDGLLGAVRRHLRSGGLFAFDTRNPSPLHLESDRSETEWFTYQHPERGLVRVSGYQVYDEGTQIQTWTTFRRWGAGQESRSQIRLRYTPPAELEALLVRHGFEVLERYGDWGLGPVSRPSWRDSPTSVQYFHRLGPRRRKKVDREKAVPNVSLSDSRDGPSLYVGRPRLRRRRTQPSTPAAAKRSRSMKRFT